MEIFHPASDRIITPTWVCYIYLTNTRAENNPRGDVQKIVEKIPYSQAESRLIYRLFKILLNEEYFSFKTGIIHFTFSKYRRNQILFTTIEYNKTVRDFFGKRILSEPGFRGRLS